jgi:hypothetical protein
MQLVFSFFVPSMTTPRTLLASALMLILAACTPAAPGDSDSSASSSADDMYSDMIQVDGPQENAVVDSPLIITGKARGTWYFEASFPVKLYDDEGNLLAQGPAQAQGEWMTEDFVPFSAQLTFVTTAENGVLVLEKDNPSGLPENAASISIPVQFAQ